MLCLARQVIVLTLKNGSFHRPNPRLLRLSANGHPTPRESVPSSAALWLQRDSPSAKARLELLFTNSTCRDLLAINKWSLERVPDIIVIRLCSSMIDGGLGPPQSPRPGVAGRRAMLLCSRTAL